MSRIIVGMFELSKLQKAGINAHMLMKAAEYAASSKDPGAGWKEFPSETAPEPRSGIPLWAVHQRLAEVAAGDAEQPVDWSRYHGWTDEDEHLNLAMEREAARERVMQMQQQMIRRQVEAEQLGSNGLKLVY